MDLHRVSDFFDREVFQDYFHPAVTFKGQVRMFADSTRSAAATPRRVLSVALNVVIPERRIVKMAVPGTVYIVGGPNEDYWQNRVIRTKYPMIPVTQIASVGTIGEHLAGDGLEEELFVFTAYVRRIPLEDESSKFYSGYEVYFSSYENINRDQILLIGSDYYRAKVSTSIDGAGFGMVEAARLDEPMTTLTYVQSGAVTAYDPVTDAQLSPTTLSGVAAFVEPARFDFQYAYPSFDKVEAGDTMVSVLKTAVSVARSGDTAGAKTVLSVRDGGDFWTLHCR